MSSLLRVVACVGIASFYWINQAQADVVLPDFSAGVNVSACDCESGVSASGTSADVVWPPPNITSSVVSGEAKGTVSNQSVSLSATLSQANNDTGIGLGRAEATGSLTYYFRSDSEHTNRSCEKRTCCCGRRRLAQRYSEFCKYGRFDERIGLYYYPIRRL